MTHLNVVSNNISLLRRGVVNFYILLLLCASRSTVCHSFACTLFFKEDLMLRRSYRTLMTTFSLLGILALLLAACGPSSSTSNTSGDNSSSSKQVHGGTWTDDLDEEPSSLIPNDSRGPE